MVLLDYLGRRWALRIIWELRQQRLTFRELQQACGGVSPTVLNSRLAELRELSIVAGSDGTGYQLTPAGRDLGASLSKLHTWAERHV